MSKITVTTKTSAQIDADFEVAFANIEPTPAARPLTRADQLEPYRKAVLKQRRRGLTWVQIANGMAHPRVSEKVSAKTLRLVFGGKTKAAAKVPGPLPKLVLDPTTGKPVTPAPAPQRLILDPVTMRPITPKPTA